MTHRTRTAYRPNPEVCGPAPLTLTGEQATVAGSVSTAVVGPELGEK